MLRWSEGVAAAMARIGIANRRDLADRLDIGKSTVYRNFDESWRGEVSISVLAALVGAFALPLGELVEVAR